MDVVLVVVLNVIICVAVNVMMLVSEGLEQPVELTIHVSIFLATATVFF